MPEIWTIGHSTRTAEDFAALLRAHGITLLADVRSYPGSRRCPWFSATQMPAWLADAGIGYLPVKGLGGRRHNQDVPREVNGGWRNTSFRYYADYALGEEFADALRLLVNAARQQRVAYMCSEAVPWRCHRMILSDHLVLAGWQVHHITSSGPARLHVPGQWGAAPIRGRDGTVTYPDGQLPLPGLAAAS